MNRTLDSRTAVPCFTALLIVVLVAGCNRAGEQKPERPAPGVVVADVVQKTVPVRMQFAGTVESVRAVDIIPRVSGHIEERFFEEGTFVEEGARLYLIDPRPFQASLDAAEAQLARDRASENFWKIEAARYTKLARANAGTVEDRDKAVSMLNEMKGAVAADLADVDSAKLDLAYSNITAPFAGRIEDTQVYKGDVVTAQREVLTTLVQIDPIHVVFNMSRRLAARIQEMRAAGLAPATLEDFEVNVRLSDGSTYGQAGHLDFVSAQVDTKTDTLVARAVFPNRLEGTTEYPLFPGQYAPLTLTAGKQPDAILIPQAALVQSQVGSQVFVVGKDGKVESRSVEVDRAHEQQWVIRKGLVAGERVVVSGLQKIRSGMAVKVVDAKQQTVRG